MHLLVIFSHASLFSWDFACKKQMSGLRRINYKKGTNSFLLWIESTGRYPWLLRDTRTSCRRKSGSNRDCYMPSPPNGNHFNLIQFYSVQWPNFSSHVPLIFRKRRLMLIMSFYLSLPVWVGWSRICKVLRDRGSGAIGNLLAGWHKLPRRSAVRSPEPVQRPCRLWGTESEGDQERSLSNGSLARFLRPSGSDRKGPHREPPWASLGPFPQQPAVNSQAYVRACFHLFLMYMYINPLKK